MLVFWHAKLVLLSVPKTGTTALQNALGPDASLAFRSPPNLKHAHVYRYHRFVKPMLAATGAKDMELMAILRDPVDWLGSWYRYRHRDELVGHPNSTRDVSFDDFVRAYCRESDQPAYAKVGSQAKFLLNPDQELGVHHLFQYEQYPLAVAFLERRLGKKITLPQSNVSPKFEITLSSDVRALLEQTHPAEFTAWEIAYRNTA